MDYPCTACGCCCRRVVAIPGVFPEEWVGEDGACVHLTENELCGIYETRPECCRVGYSFAGSGLTDREYLEMTANVCNALMDEMGVKGKRVVL